MGNFETILRYFCAHSATDRWEPDDLRCLADALGTSLDAAPEIQKLQSQPMDGAIILSDGGSLLAAAVKLNHSQQRWRLKKSDGTFAGTRHASALSTAVWLGNRTVRTSWEPRKKHGRGAK